MSDAVKKFWLEWLKTDIWNRPMKLRQLAKMGLDGFLKHYDAKEIDEQMLHAFCTLWNSYFEDFYNVMIEEAEKAKMHPAQLGTSVKNHEADNIIILGLVMIGFASGWLMGTLNIFGFIAFAGEMIILQGLKRKDSRKRR